MRQEEKQILLKDLSARLPYGVKLETLEGPQELDMKWLSINMCNISNPYLPYLFPLSSMTEEQKYDFYCRFIENNCDFDDFKEFYLDNGMLHKLLTSLDDIEGIINWFHKKHIDYRGLIPKRLAIDCTNLNIY